jgi:uncharacterized protein with von Willebrand factor type A (vWA) domain
VNQALSDPSRLLVRFAQTLRSSGWSVTPDRVQAMAAGMDALGGATISSAYWAGRLTLCSGPDDLPRYDAAFSAFFGGRPLSAPRAWTTASVVTSPSLENGQVAAGSNGKPDGPVPVLRIGASSSEVLRHRDVAALSAAERAQLRQLLSLLAPDTAPRRSRRRRPARRGEVDVRRTIRRSMRRAGEPSHLERRRRRDKPRRLVLLLDVSGSMSSYADSFLRFGHAAVRRRPSSTEVFTIGTRLARVTRELRHRDPDAALRAAGQAIPDWHGGTRLADTLQAFMLRWGRRGLARGAVVVLCSDGWERGDPQPLADQVEQLSRLAYRLIWVNPHRGKAGYAPVQAGMAAVLPYLDDFVAGHNLAALEDLVEVISRA